MFKRTFNDIFLKCRVSKSGLKIGDLNEIHGSLLAVNKDRDQSTEQVVL